MIKMIIGLLLAVAIPVIVIVLLVQLNKKATKQLDELGKIRQCLEAKAPEQQPDAKSLQEITAQVMPEEPEAEQNDSMIEEMTDAPKNPQEALEASKYNTGKSGKVYTKEELELLIKE